MNPSLHTILSDLLTLQSDLTATVNELWRLKLALASHHYNNEDDFLPRRFEQCRLQAEGRQNFLLGKLRHKLAGLEKSFLVFSSEDDVEIALRLRTLIRYLQNAFDQDLPLGPALKRMKSGAL